MIEISDCSQEQVGVISEHAKTGVTSTTKDSTKSARCVAVIDCQSLCVSTDLAGITEVDELFVSQVVSVPAVYHQEAWFAIARSSWYGGCTLSASSLWIKLVVWLNTSARGAILSSFGTFGAHLASAMFIVPRVVKDGLATWTGFGFSRMCFPISFLHAFFASRVFAIRGTTALFPVKIILTMLALLAFWADTSSAGDMRSAMGGSAGFVHKMKYNRVNNLHHAEHE
jgi:hypothetical protein